MIWDKVHACFMLFQPVRRLRVIGTLRPLCILWRFPVSKSLLLCECQFEGRFKSSLSQRTLVCLVHSCPIRRITSYFAFRYHVRKTVETERSIVDAVARDTGPAETKFDLRFDKKSRLSRYCPRHRLPMPEVAGPDGV